MRKRKTIVFSLALCAVFLLYFSLSAGEEAIELKFSHQLHVEEMDLECATCHGEAETSTSGEDNLMPAMETCGDCHDIESTDNCNLCHSDMENPRAVPRVKDYSVLFSHQQHLEADLQCESCHENVIEKTAPEPYILPDMAQCMSCHEVRQVTEECSACHTPEFSLKPPNHGLDFSHVHGNLAQLPEEKAQTSQNCNLCHEPNFCQNCHEGDNLDRTTHPLNYEFTHSLDARGKERECATCHTQRSFCADCHAQNLVMPQNHTVGWANRIPGDGGLHRLEAQNDLGNCMTCHEPNAEQTCQKSGCHSK